GRCDVCPRLSRLERDDAAVGVAACASQGMPPGGPPDAEIPQIVQLLPDTNAVNVRVPAVVLRFDEVVNERSAATPPRGGGGAPDSRACC
ncbi:MAG TPA: hypothetical protein PLY94_07610, partial [Gemmatimonadaceae bacterium]|nr:hypothetical protein [Gemmatimonadaceae bacterium]